MTGDLTGTASTASSLDSTLSRPIASVSVVSTGTVQIHPQQPFGTRIPMMVWLFGSRRWTPPLPINAYIIEHADGIVLFDTGQDRASVTDPDYFPGGMTGFLYRRLARFLDAWLLLVTGGPPTADKPSVTFEAPVDPDHVNAELIIGVPDCRAAYALLSARGASFLAPPVEYAWEIRAFFRDPDGHLFEISEHRGSD